MPQLPQGFVPPAPGGSYLITGAQEPTPFTGNQETDARTALTRALAEYLAQLEYEAVGGRFLRLERVFETWADPEDEGVYPSAYVGATGNGTYEDARMSPSIGDARLRLPDGRYVVSPCDYVIDLNIEVRTDDPEARLNLTAMLERDLNPVDWRYGFMLVMPHYFNQRGTFEVISSGYQDAEITAQQRLRIVTFDVKARVPLTRLRSYPQAQIRTKVTTV